MWNAFVALGVLVLVAAGRVIYGTAIGRGVASRGLGRKLAHVGFGLLLLLSWLLYDDGPGARWVAALPPLAVGAYFVALGAGLASDDVTVRAASRSGQRAEMLLGPTFFTAAFLVATLVGWRSPVALTSLTVLVFGDGAAEVAGTRIPSPRLPWNPRKSLAGSLGMLVTGWGAAVGVLALFRASGLVGIGAAEAWAALLAVAAAGALAESVTSGSWDNLVIPAACAAAGVLLL